MQFIWILVLEVNKVSNVRMVYGKNTYLCSGAFTALSYKVSYSIIIRQKVDWPTGSALYRLNLRSCWSHSTKTISNTTAIFHN